MILYLHRSVSSLLYAITNLFQKESNFSYCKILCQNVEKCILNNIN